MELLSQLRTNEDLYYIDITNLNQGIKVTPIIYAGYEHKDMEFYGCGCSGPEDTWTIRFNTEFGEKFISFHHANTPHQYFHFKDVKNENGRANVTSHNLLVCANKNILIKELKRSANDAYNDVHAKISLLKNELAQLEHQEIELLKNIELVNSL